MNGSALKMKKPGVTFDPFDVVVVEFPFVDMPVIKRRPAVVLSAHDSFGALTGAAMTAMISAPLQSSWPHDVSIADPVIAGLNKPSLIRMKIMTIDLRLFVRRIGTLGEKDRHSVRAAVGEAMAGIFKAI